MNNYDLSELQMLGNKLNLIFFSNALSAEFEL